MILPLKVDEATFLSAIKGFKQAVGDEWVFTDDENLELYRDAYSPFWGEDGELRASAAVAPASAEEVQKVVRIANEFKIPVFPISTGMNLGYGGAAPNMRGSVMIDMKRMNKVIEIDETRCFAIVEPGVSYFDLYRYIEERGLDLMVDVPDPGWGSVMGNALDHGAGFTKGVYKDHWGSHSGLEVVLANGELMRIGMGAMNKAETFAEYPYGYGPTVDGLFAQGSAGIVIKMGMRLQPKPPAALFAKVSMKRRSDMVPLMKIRNRLEQTGMIAFGRIWSDLALAPPEPGLAELLFDPKGWENHVHKIEQWVADRGLPFWTFTFPIHGPRKANEANWEYIQGLFKEAIPDAKLELEGHYDFPLSDDDIKEIKHPVEVGVPNLDIFFIGARTPNNPNPSDGHIWFSPVIPASGEAMLNAQEVFAKALREAGLPPLYGPFSFPLPMRDGIVLMTGLPIFKGNPERAAITRKMFSTLITIAADNGWGEYRTHPAFQDQVMRSYDFNDNALLKFHETIKDALDPNGIISPGRAGIWPKHLRGNKV